MDTSRIFQEMESLCQQIEPLDHHANIKHAVQPKARENRIFLYKKMQNLVNFDGDRTRALQHR
jgi:hypothetical protein